VTVVTQEELQGVARTLTRGQLDRYLKSRQAGDSPRLALVIATRQFPAVNRKEEMWRLKDSSQQQGRKALRSGHYMETMADPAAVKQHGSDPRAYVESMKEARELAERRGLQIIDRAEIEADLNDPARNGEPVEEDECLATVM
jgi:hypothetical protein